MSASQFHYIQEINGYTVASYSTQLGGTVLARKVGNTEWTQFGHLTASEFESEILYQLAVEWFSTPVIGDVDLTIIGNSEIPWSPAIQPGPWHVVEVAHRLGHERTALHMALRLVRVYGETRNADVERVAGWIAAQGNRTPLNEFMDVRRSRKATVYQEDEVHAITASILSR